MLPPDTLSAFAEGTKKMPYVLSSLGLKALRPGQDRAVRSIMMGRDTVVILPTGAGKSLCFTVPALCMGWKTIIIYPLIALMRDQAAGMQRRGLAAACISSNETDAHNAAVIRDWATGNLQFMMVSPERFANAAWAEVVTQFPPDFVAIDECFTGDVELLTKRGFVKFSHLIDNDVVAQVDPDSQEITYVIPDKIIRRHHVGDVVRITSTKGIDLTMTPSHELLVYRRDGSWRKRTAADIKFSVLWKMLGAPSKAKGRDELTCWERLQTAFQADGSVHSVSSVLFAFVKQRKITRFLQLMQDGGYAFDEVKASRENMRRFIVKGVPGLSKLMRDVVDYTELSTAGCRRLVAEAIAWDGSDVSSSLGYYSSTVQANTDFFQEVCVRAGYRSRVTMQVDDRSPTFKNVHKLFIRLGSPMIDVQEFRKETFHFEGMVYCVTVPTGCIVVRRDGKPVVVGNCHTLAEWQDTFRPGFKVAGEFIKNVRPRVVAAFSATLSEDAEKEAREGLGITGANLVYHYPRRENLHLATLRVDSIRDAYPWVVSECKGPTIIYASTRARVEGYASDLARFTQRPVYYYHGGMKPADKKYQQDKFMTDNDAIIVATNAFGMGIDKENIRNVVHFDIPGTLVAYSQEAGRAGRDGLTSYCTIIPTPEGIRTRRHFIRCGNPTEQDIRDFVKAAAGMRAGRDGIISAKRDDIARKAGLDVMTIQAIMAFCLGERILVHDGDAAKKMRVKFMPDVPSFSRPEAEMRTAITDLGVDIDGDGWLHLDIRALAEQLGREPATITSRLKSMNDSGKIIWVRSATAKPLRLGVDIDAVNPEAFARLNSKSAEASNNLQMVLDFCDIADEDKHSFLESHLNR